MEEDDDPMHRRRFLAGTAAAAALGGWGTPAEASAVHVGRTEIDTVRELAVALKASDMRHGGGARLDEALRRASDTLLIRHATVPGRLRPDLMTALGWLAGNVGFMLHDAGRDSEAVQWWATAEGAAKDAGNWSLRARILGMQARQALSRDRPAAALSYLDAALADPRGALTATECAMLHALRSRARALSGTPLAALAEVDAADSELADAAPDDKEGRPWIAHYDLPHHSGEVACALAHIAKGGHHRVLAQAGGRHELGARHAGEGARRTAVLNLLKLSTLDMETGDVERAVRTGHEALDWAASLRSARVLVEVGLLRTAAEQHVARPDVADLRDRCIELVA